jgi:alcohol dehydrogenase (cytochrome c)
MDWDLGAAPMLYRDGEDRDMVAVAGKDGYLHAIDRVHQIARFRVPTTTVGITKGAAGSSVVCPGIGGGTLWNGPAFAPDSQTIFTGALDFCAIVSADSGEKYKTSRFLAGGSVQPVGTPSGWISAFDATSGQLRWKYHTDAPVVAGITPTAGGLLMAGDNAGNFFVLNSKTGQLLKKMPMKGSLSGGVVTYLVNNVQYVALDAGNVSRTSFGVAGRPAIVILKVPEALGKSQNQADAVTEHGRDIYQRDCLACHGFDFEGMKGVTLKAIGKRMTRDQLVNWIRHPGPPMPTVFPDPLDSQDKRDLEALASYLMEQ